MKHPYHLTDGVLPLKITIGDKYCPAMEITEQADADAYFAACVDHNLRVCAAEGTERTRDEAEAQERANLGYFAGYYGSETRRRVEKLFACQHPVFGSIAEHGPPTTDAAFAAGTRMAREGR